MYNKRKLLKSGEKVKGYDYVTLMEHLIYLSTSAAVETTKR